MAAVRDKFLAVRAELNNVLLERTSAIDNALLALVTGEHLLLLGPPGTAKSLLVDELHKRIIGANRFKKLLNASTAPEELLGPTDLIAMADQGRYLRRKTRAITEAHLAFLDEVFKSNSMVLHLLLGIMNEREVDEIGMDDTLHVPLISLFGASNETPQDESLRAFDDRFALRDVVQYLSEEQSFYAVVTGQTKRIPVQATVTLEDIYEAQRDVLQVKGSMPALQALWQLRCQLSAQGVAVSDRRFTACGKLIKAQAWLDGQAEMDVEHLVCLIHALWTEPKEKATVTRLVYALACPLAWRAVEIEDSAAELMSKLPKADHGDYNACAENVLQQLVDMHTQLKEELSNSSARNTERAHQALSKIAAYHKQVSTQLFTSVSRLSLAV